jgi:2-polyprenyl-3-methyl-5-hydroxy-6-metoxy-1,4-benzoquinol methylase
VEQYASVTSSSAAAPPPPVGGDDQLRPDHDQDEPPLCHTGTRMIRDRCMQPEVMDQADLDPALHVQALGGLRRLNVVCRSAAILWPEIAAAARRIAPVTLQVLDVGCGGGDNAIAIARRAKRVGLAIHVVGCDISPLALGESRARAQAAKVDNVSFTELDVLHQPFPAGFHVITCSLFLHHFDQQRAVELLSKMAAAASELVLISDLRRTRLGYALAWIGSRLFTRSPVVRVDGPRSVAAAFTPGEALALARRAGLEDATITYHWPQRWRLSWKHA